MLDQKLEEPRSFFHEQGKRRFDQAVDLAFKRELQKKKGNEGLDLSLPILAALLTELA